MQSHVDRLVPSGKMRSPLDTVEGPSRGRQGDGGKKNVESKTRAGGLPDFELTNQ